MRKGFSKIYQLLFFFSSLSSFAQGDNSSLLTFDFNEIQVFTGLTNNGTQILKLDENGVLLRIIDIGGDSNSISHFVDFRKLEGKELKDFRKNYKKLLEYLNGFDFEDYQPAPEKTETRVVNGDTLTSSQIISTHDLGTRILIIDNDFKCHYIRYFYCDETLDELVERINKIIPAHLRFQYQFRKRCE